MRELNSFKIMPDDDSIKVVVTDEPRAGGACREYVVTCKGDIFPMNIHFQSGPRGGGLTQEVLLSIVEDRLKSFQAGPYSCRENALALTHIQEAMHWLQCRTRDRMFRGVDGKCEK